MPHFNALAEVIRVDIRINFTSPENTMIVLPENPHDRIFIHLDKTPECDKQTD